MSDVASGPRPRLLIAYDGSDLAAAAVRSAAELFPGSTALVVTVWEPGLGTMVAVDPSLDVAGIAPVQLSPELVSELDKAGEQHAAIVAQEGAELAGSLGLDRRPGHPARCSRRGGGLTWHHWDPIPSAREHFAAYPRALQASGGGDSAARRSLMVRRSSRGRSRHGR